MLARPFLAVALCLATASVCAAGLNFLGRGPMGKFNDADFDLFRGALGRALTTGAMDQPIDWSNPATRSGGSFTPQKAFERDGAPCRTLRVQTRHAQLAADGVYTMCRRQGRWVLANS